MRQRKNIDKLNDAQKKDTEDQKKDIAYRRGIALTQATKAA